MHSVLSSLHRLLFYLFSSYYIFTELVMPPTCTCQDLDLSHLLIGVILSLYAAWYSAANLRMNNHDRVIYWIAMPKATVIIDLCSDFMTCIVWACIITYMYSKLKLLYVFLCYYWDCCDSAPSGFRSGGSSSRGAVTNPRLDSYVQLLERMSVSSMGRSLSGEDLQQVRHAASRILAHVASLGECQTGGCLTRWMSDMSPH